MSYILGIDCSSSTVHSVLLDSTGNFLFSNKCENRTKDIDLKFNYVCDRFSEFLDNNADMFANTTAVIENPVMIQNVKATITIAIVISGVKRELYKHNIAYWGIDNKSWKKDVLGNGAAQKEEIMRFSEMKWGKGNFTEQDYADASCIALWGVLRFANGS